MCLDYFVLIAPPPPREMGKIYGLMIFVLPDFDFLKEYFQEVIGGINLKPFQQRFAAQKKLIKFPQCGVFHSQAELHDI